MGLAVKLPNFEGATGCGAKVAMATMIVDDQMLPAATILEGDK